MKVIHSLLLFITLSISQLESAPLILQTLYGEFIVEDPLAIELIESAPFQRLKGLHQYGFTTLLKPTEHYTRYIHSIGVYYVLNKFGCSREEQIAGLLHDVSHTALSHVGDYVFGSNQEFKSYQDDIHTWYIEKSGLAAILERYGYTPSDLHPENACFTALKCPLPNLNADRIDYNLQGALLRGLITQDDFDQFLNDLYLVDGVWLVTSAKSAKMLANASLNMTSTLWGSPWESLVNHVGAQAIKRAFEIGLISLEEFHFSTDAVIWEKLNSCSDNEIVECLATLKNMDSLFTLAVKGEEDFALKEKCRGVNPLVLTASGVHRLSDLDSEFRQSFSFIKKSMENGWPIKWLGSLIVEEIH